MKARLSIILRHPIRSLWRTQNRRVSHQTTKHLNSQRGLSSYPPITKVYCCALFFFFSFVLLFSPPPQDTLSIPTFVDKILKEQETNKPTLQMLARVCTHTQIHTHTHTIWKALCWTLLHFMTLICTPSLPTSSDGRKLPRGAASLCGWQTNAHLRHSGLPILKPNHACSLACAYSKPFEEWLICIYIYAFFLLPLWSLNHPLVS